MTSDLTWYIYHVISEHGIEDKIFSTIKDDMIYEILEDLGFTVVKVTISDNAEPHGNILF